jgi:hypothetical protein
LNRLRTSQEFVLEKSKSIALIALVSLLLASCGALEGGMVEDPGSDEISTTQDDQSADEVLATQVVEEDALTPPAHDASGLIFTNADGTWWVNRDGEVDLLTEAEWAVRSNDGLWYAYSSTNPDTDRADIFTMNIATGEVRNITNTPDRDEENPIWIPGDQGVLAFGSDTFFGITNSSYPTVVNLDGSGYQVLDQETGGFRGVSADGTTIIYGGSGKTLEMIGLDGSHSAFDPAQYGVELEKIFIAEWSPDNQRIALFAGFEYTDSGSLELGIAVIDLAANTYVRMHSYTPLGGGMFHESLAWSSDGEWIAFTTSNEPPSSSRAPNLWVIREDGTEESYIGTGFSPVWRYDGQMLAYTALNEAQTEVVFLAEVDNWTSKQIVDLPLPERIGRLLDWDIPN